MDLHQPNRQPAAPIERSLQPCRLRKAAVSGSDASESEATRDLQQHGARVAIKAITHPPDERNPGDPDRRCALTNSELPQPNVSVCPSSNGLRH